MRIPGFCGAKRIRVIDNLYTTQNRKFTRILHCKKSFSTSGDDVKSIARVVSSTSEWKKNVHISFALTDEVSMKNLGFFPFHWFELYLNWNVCVVFYFLIILRPGKEKKMDTNTATIIAIIVGDLFAVTVTIIFIVFVVRKRNRKDSRRRQPLEITETGKSHWFEKTILNKVIICKPWTYHVFGLHLYTQYAS